MVNEMKADENVTMEKARNKFLSFKTYQLLCQRGEDYYHVDPSFFFDLWQNELRVGELITSEELEFTDAGQKLLKENL